MSAVTLAVITGAPVNASGELLVVAAGGVLEAGKPAFVTIVGVDDGVLGGYGETAEAWLAATNMRTSAAATTASSVTLRMDAAA